MLAAEVVGIGGGRGESEFLRCCARADSRGEPIMGLTFALSSILIFAALSLRFFPYEDVLGRSKPEACEGVVLSLAAVAAGVGVAWLVAVGIGAEGRGIFPPTD